MDFSLTQEQVDAIESTDCGKYSHDPQHWITEMLDRALELGMNRGGQKLWCLDLDSNIPYFAWVAGKYGHDVLSVGDPMYADAADVLGCEFVPRPMSTAPHRFDLVTVFDPSCDNESEFKQEMVTTFSLLVPTGRLVVAPHLGYLGNVWRNIAWWQEFIPDEEAKAEKNRDWIVLTAK